MIDSDPSSIDEFKSGTYSGLYSDEQYVAGKESAKDSFAHGRNSSAASLTETCLESVRKQAEKCDSLQGF